MADFYTNSRFGVNVWAEPYEITQQKRLGPATNRKAVLICGMKFVTVLVCMK